MPLKSNQTRCRARAIPGKAMLGYSKNKGTPQITVPLEILDGDGGEISWTSYFTPGSQEYTIKAMRTLGFRGDDVNDLSSIGGKAVSIVVEDEEYEGNVYQRVKFIDEIGGYSIPEEQRMGDAERKKFAAQMRGAFHAVDMAGGSATKAQPAARTPPAQRGSGGAPRAPSMPPPQQPPPDFGPGDDDIPF